MEIVASGRRDMKPLLLKAGIALALSIAGFLISHLRCRLRQPVPCSPSEPPEAGGKGLKDELRFLKNQDDSTAKIINGTSTTTTTTTTTTTKTFVSLSPKSRSSGDDEGYLLPEFKDLVLEAASPRYLDAIEESAMEHHEEILRLKKLVWSLEERERSLQLQLFEYYGLQEQENTVRELESQLRINNMEAKLLALEMESLQGDYRRLQMDYSKGMSELDAARGAVKSLKRKMKSESEQSREKIAALQQRVSVLQSREEAAKEKADADAERRLKRYEELESEAADLRMLNSRLEQMNSELRQQLEASIPEAKDVEEAKHLKATNSKLLEEIEQLQTSHCADVEELVYLRWVNACLRYEARNYQPPPGKTMARDLSKTLSPKSEEKAKQLILRYANSLDSTRSSPAMDFDTECSPSSSQTLSVGESDEASCDASSPVTSTGRISTKSKLFRKLKKLILRKGTHHHHHRSSPPVSADVTPTSCSNSERRVSFSTCSMDDMIGGRYSDSVSSSSATERTPDNQFAAREAAQVAVAVDGQRRNKQGHDTGRSSLDIQGMRRGDKSADNTPYGFKRTTSAESSDGGSAGNGGRHARDPEKAELKKFAEALNRSRVMKKFVRSSTKCTD